MSKLPENWTDKEFMEDATWLTPHERIEQEEHDAKMDDMIYGWQIPTKADWDNLEQKDTTIVRYPITMKWEVE